MPFWGQFGGHFRFREAKTPFWKQAFRLRHPSKMDVLPQNASEERVSKNCTKKWFIFGQKMGPKRYLKSDKNPIFFFRFFGKTCIWAQTSCKKWHSGNMLAPAAQLMKNLDFWALACTPGPKCDFRLSKKIYFFHAAIIENCALACTRSPFLLFCAFRKKWKKKITVFAKIAFYDVNMHIFAARGFQNGENGQLLGYYFCQDSKWVLKWSQNVF